MNEIAIVIIAVLGGAAGGMWYGERGKSKMLANMLAYGSPWVKEGGKTIVPETAEVRLDRDAKLIEREYQEATIMQGVGELQALYIAEGRPSPSQKDLRKEVEDMLSRAGTAEAGVPHG